MHPPPPGGRYELILTLPAHHAEVWGLAISRDGGVVVSASRDRSLRLWRRTDEQVFLEEEREAEAELALNAAIEKTQQTAEAAEEEADALGIDGGAADAGVAGRRTIESISGAERILEALRTLSEEDERVAEHAAAVERAAKSRAAAPPLVPNMLLLGLDADAYVLKALSSVRPADLEQALLLLPFDAMRRLLERLLPLLPSAPHVELIARTILFALHVNHKQLVGSRASLPLLHALDSKLRERLSRERDVVGYNLAALRHVQQIAEANDGAAFFEDAISAIGSSKQASTAELRRRTAAREAGGKGQKRRR